MASTVLHTIREHIEAVAAVPANILANHVVAAPPDHAMGDIASNIALISAGHFKKKPIELAQEIAKKLTADKLFSEVTAVAPGFINVRLSEAALSEALREAVKKESEVLRQAEGKKARVEFISANPTGPLHIGNARGGPLGDTIANVLAANGYTVLREYLHNDVGGQVQKLGESVVGTGDQYTGGYVEELRKQIDTKDPKEAGTRAVAILFDEILNDAKAMGVTFDEVYPESMFVETNQTKQALDELEQAGVLKKQEGAVWLAPSDEFLKDRETVVIKSNGSYTYFANDIAYHNLKFSENYDLVIDVLGSNHHGHVPRLKAVIKALGFDVAKFRSVLYQFVRVKRGNDVVKMSKRAGTFVTAREVLDEVGRDAFRFFMLLHDPNTHMDFDLELAKAKTKENPVYYVQYAAVRCRSIERKSQFQNPNFKINPKSQIQITNAKERELALALVQLPDLIQEIGESLAVHKLAHYAVNVAGLFHHFYESEKVLDDDAAVRQSRLALCSATLSVLEQCLGLMGISVPEKM